MRALVSDKYITILLQKHGILWGVADSGENDRTWAFE